MANVRSLIELIENKNYFDRLGEYTFELYNLIQQLAKAGLLHTKDPQHGNKSALEAAIDSNNYLAIMHMQTLDVDFSGLISRVYQDKLKLMLDKVKSLDDLYTTPTHNTPLEKELISQLILLGISVEEIISSIITIKTDRRSIDLDKKATIEIINLFCGDKLTQFTANDLSRYNIHKIMCLIRDWRGVLQKAISAAPPSAQTTPVLEFWEVHHELSDTYLASLPDPTANFSDTTLLITSLLIGALIDSCLMLQFVLIGNLVTYLNQQHTSISTNEADRLIKYIHCLNKSYYQLVTLGVKLNNDITPSSVIPLLTSGIQDVLEKIKKGFATVPQQRCLRDAMLAQEYPLMEELIRKGAKLDELYDNKSILYLAAERGDAKAVQLLLTHKRNFPGLPALTAATEAGDLEITAMLLAAGLNPNSVRQTDNQTALSLAVAKKNRELTRLIVTNMTSKKPLDLFDKHVTSALQASAQNNRYDLVNTILFPNHRAASTVKTDAVATFIYYLIAKGKLKNISHEMRAHLVAVTEPSKELTQQVVALVEREFESNALFKLIRKLPKYGHVEITAHASNDLITNINNTVNTALLTKLAEQLKLAQIDLLVINRELLLLLQHHLLEFVKTCRLLCSKIAANLPEITTEAGRVLTSLSEHMNKMMKMADKLFSTYDMASPSINKSSNPFPNLLKSIRALEIENTQAKQNMVLAEEAARLEAEKRAEEENARAREEARARLDAEMEAKAMEEKMRAEEERKRIREEASASQTTPLATASPSTLSNQPQTCQVTTVTVNTVYIVPVLVPYIVTPQHTAQNRFFHDPEVFFDKMIADLNRVCTEEPSKPLNKAKILWIIDEIGKRVTSEPKPTPPLLSKIVTALSKSCQQLAGDQRRPDSLDVCFVVFSLLSGLIKQVDERLSLKPVLIGTPLAHEFHLLKQSENFDSDNINHHRDSIQQLEGFLSKCNAESTNLNRLIQADIYLSIAQHELAIHKSTAITATDFIDTTKTHSDKINDYLACSLRILFDIYLGESSTHNEKTCALHVLMTVAGLHKTAQKQFYVRVAEHSRTQQPQQGFGR